MSSLGTNRSTMCTCVTASIVHTTTNSFTLWFEGNERLWKRHREIVLEVFFAASYRTTG